MSEQETNLRKVRLRRELLDKAYREQYATSTLIHNVSAQLQVLRRQRGLSQEDLARRSATKQPRISNVETPPEGDRPPNWEIDTLNRIAHALGTRLKVSFETYGSLVDELDTITSESLRRVDLESDPVLFPRPEMPSPDPDAPERTRWMQELMIPWLWQDEALGTDQLVDWLQGRGLPPVGHDEEPYHWLLRGIKIQGKTRDFLEKRFAERLAVVLGYEPDVHPMTPRRNEDFLANLYWTCAGLSHPSFLAEQLWYTYKRLKDSKPSGAVRDALQGAMVRNQFGETKPLKELWEPMVERGRHRWLRGNEIIGYEGILARHLSIKPDLDKLLWALTVISRRWDASRQSEFRRLMWRIPGLDRLDVAKRLFNSASRGWSDWARHLLPVLQEERSSDGSLEVTVRFGGTEAYAKWPVGGFAHTGVRKTGPKSVELMERSQLSGEPRPLLLLNELLTRLGDDTDATASEQRIAHALVFNHLIEVRSTRDQDVPEPIVLPLTAVALVSAIAA